MDSINLNIKISSLFHSNSLKSKYTNYSQKLNSNNPLKKIQIKEKTNRTFNLQRSSSLPKIYTPYSNARNKILNKIYQENGDWFNKFKQIKKNNCIAIKKNFNIVNYQHKLFDIFISNNARLENNKILCKMKKNFMKIQKILNNERTIQKNKRWNEIADKLQYLIPEHLISKIRALSM
jgi:hypothetical protein